MAIHRDETQVWDPGVWNREPSSYLKSRIFSEMNKAIISDTSRVEDEDSDDAMEHEESRMELDSHANMVVVGKSAYIISDTGETVDVQPFTSEYEAKTSLLLPFKTSTRLCP